MTGWWWRTETETETERERETVGKQRESKPGKSPGKPTAFFIFGQGVTRTTTRGYFFFSSGVIEMIEAYSLIDIDSEFRVSVCVCVDSDPCTLYSVYICHF